MIPHAMPNSTFRSPATPHFHIAGDTCPLCEQDIPPEKLEEISGRIALKQHEQTRAITAQLELQHEIDREQADLKAQAVLELERQQGLVRETVARDEARKAAEVVAAQQLAVVETNRQELQAALQKQKDDTEAARSAAEQAAAAATAQFEKLRQDTETAKAAALVDAEKRETEIRGEAQKAADAASAEKLAAAEASRQVLETALQQQKKDTEAARLTAEQATANQLAASEAKHSKAFTDAQALVKEAELKKAAAEEARAELLLQLDAVQTAKITEIANLKKEAEASAERIRQEAIAAAQAVVAVQLTEKDQATADAQAKTAEAEAKVVRLVEQQPVLIAESLREQREALEKAKDVALNAERAEKFLETQKLNLQIDALKRTLEEKAADELGEGAEIDLYEALRAEFPDDKIDRVGKGVAGGDVLHVVMHSGRGCGTIIYDSKNHKVFRSDFVTKLLADQSAANAEHAILSLHKFPRGTGQLHNLDGVLLANPARVVAVVTMIRLHMVQTHTLRLSSAERESKTAALYEFIVSEQCAQFFARLDNCAEDLLDLQVKEKKQHETNWKKQGETLRLIQKVQADLSNRIGSITGTAAADEELEFEEASQ